MSKIKKPIIFSDFFTEGQYETEVALISEHTGSNKLNIGVPKETILSERRVTLVPHSVRTLIGYGHEVTIESGAGLQANFTDLNYAEAGAKITHSREEIFKSQIIVKIAPPTNEEIAMMHPDQVLISPLQLPVLKDDYLENLTKKRITALAMEYIQSDNGEYPIVKIMSEIAGSCAILTAAEYLNNTREGGRGVLLGGISGVPPAKVVILGAGMVAEAAIKVAISLGASIRVFDNDIIKIMRLQHAVGKQLHTSSINPVYLAYQLTSADVVIGAIHSKTGRSPIIITEEMVANMKDGAVIIDVSIDQGGCIETSHMTTLDNPSFVSHGVVHYCVPNITSKVSRTASIAVSNIVTLLLLQMGNKRNLERVLYDSPGIRHGCYTYKGCITNEYLSRRFNMKYTNLELLMTSKQ
ncbi:MAG TPA: alanine dehydrogenase [Saprospiraceae bacterium]|jgi:alanine dehydrogenase|nr:alanine dehydrogenase [Saprospiraceae bacterium]HRO08845.1 alanine dehydrogenase [Saprospiraceae bacterium]HRO72587.1 alanine dehydrogenase [Saprospiraceae bacterium]HRP42065.1 alanine dehydrogenase [Saprospiraceae bacterium]